MIHYMKVLPVRLRREIVGYQVAGVHRACSDSLWEPIAHAAIFRTEERAERFLAKVRAAGLIDWNHWCIPFGHTTSPVDAFHHQVATYSVL